MISCHSRRYFEDSFSVEQTKKMEGFTTLHINTDVFNLLTNSRQDLHTTTTPRIPGDDEQALR